MQTIVLHLEPGTVGFHNFDAAEYLEEMLGSFMNTKTKSGAKQEFKQKNQGLNEDIMEYFDEWERNLEDFRMHALNKLKNV